MFNWFKKKREVLDPRKDGIVGAFSKTKEGAMLMHVVGEKYSIRGNPQYEALRALDPIKSILDKLISSRLVNIIPFNVNNEKLSEPVREIARLFDLIIEAEKLEGNKRRWENWKKVMCVFFEHDIAYRYRLQWALERLNKDRIKLQETKEYNDKYFFRVKNFRVDLEEEWKEAFAKYPQLKIKQEEFKVWLSQDKNWFLKEGDQYLSLIELAPRFLQKDENT